MILARTSLLIALAIANCAFASAQDMLVEKKVMEIPAFQTVSGSRLTGVRIGYEVYGRLNAAGDNAILIPRSYSSTSHVAGKYSTTDAAPGIFDGVIGPGKTLDTDRYYIVSTDNLINVAAKDPTVTTVGPSSTNPATGKPYGMRFPIIQIRDLVNADKAILDALGVKKLHAVVGWSMGSMQAFEWSVAYPDFVSRVAALLPVAQMDGYTVAQLDNWGSAITLDPKWNNGDYYEGPAPTDGLTRALNTLHITQRSYGWGTNLAATPSKPDRSPASSWDAGFAAVANMQAASAARTRVFDANAILYGNRAMQLFSVGGVATLEEGFRPAKAKFLIVPARSDVLFFPAYGQRAVEALRKNGRDVSYLEIDGTGGHFDGVFEIKQATSALRTLLQ